MSIAALRHVVTLREPTITRNASGHRVRTYGDNDMLHYAEVMQPTGDEMLRGEGIEAISQVVFKIRYPFGEQLPTVTWQVLWDDTTYEIATATDKDGRRRYLHLLAKEAQV